MAARFEKDHEELVIVLKALGSKTTESFLQSHGIVIRFMVRQFFLVVVICHGTLSSGDLLEYSFRLLSRRNGMNQESKILISTAS